MSGSDQEVHLVQIPTLMFGCIRPYSSVYGRLWGIAGEVSPVGADDGSAWTYVISPSLAVVTAPT